MYNKGKEGMIEYELVNKVIAIPLDQRCNYTEIDYIISKCIN